MRLLLYLDQNYLSGIVKRKAAFRELEPVLRAAVERGMVAVPESEAHRVESGARPDRPLLELLRELSAGPELPHEAGGVQRDCEQQLEAILDRDFPARNRRASDRLDVRALAAALLPAASSRAMPSWRTSSAGAVSTAASAASSTPAAA